MLPAEEHLYIRPNGDRITDPSIEDLRHDFLDANPSLWSTGEGYTLLDRERTSSNHSYLSCGFSADHGYYLEAHINRLSTERAIYTPLTSNNYDATVQIWDGQTFMLVPNAFLVSPAIAADIAEHFWTTGMLLESIKWVNPHEVGWEFPMPTDADDRED